MVRISLGKICSGIPVISHLSLLRGVAKEITWRSLYVNLVFRVGGTLDCIEHMPKES